MRSFEEIANDIAKALHDNDAGLLHTLAQEMSGIGTPVATLKAEQALGTSLRFAGEYTSALEHYERALDIGIDLDRPHDIASLNSSIGIVHQWVGDYPRAVEHYQRSIAIMEDLEDKAGVAAATGNLGSVYLRVGDLPKAIEFLERSLKALTEIGDEGRIATVTGNIGLVYHATHDFDRSVENFQRSLEINSRLGLRTGTATATGNVGLGFMARGDYDQARHYCEEALRLHKEIGNVSSIANVTGHLIQIGLAMNDLEMVEQLLHEQHAMHTQDPSIRVYHYMNLASLCEARNDIEGAHTALHTAMEIATKAGLKSHEADVHGRLRELARRRQDLDGYVEHNDAYTRIIEEIRGKEATQKMAMMEADRKIEAERSEREKERALLYGTLPKEIADRLIRGEAIDDQFDEAAVLFADIVGFTTHSSSLPPASVTELLENFYSECDSLCAENHIVKVKTIGDSYLCFKGDGASAQNVDAIARVARSMQELKVSWPSGDPLVLRIGIHLGPVSSGVIGTQRLQYDIWGDTVNVASRMESTGEAGRIQVSSAFAEQLRLLVTVAEKEGTANSNSQQQLTERGAIEIKGKGTMTTYWLEGA